MLVGLIERSGKAHLLSYKSMAGSYRALCGSYFSKTSALNIVGLDNTYPGMCTFCKKHMDSIIEANLKFHTRYARSKTIGKLEASYEGHKFNYYGPLVDYGDAMYRYWPKLIRYQNHINRTVKPSRKRFIIL